MSMTEQEATNQFEHLMDNNFYLCRKTMEKWNELKTRTYSFWEEYKITDKNKDHRKRFFDWCSMNGVSKKAGLFYLNNIA